MFTQPRTNWSAIFGMYYCHNKRLWCSLPKFNSHNTRPPYNMCVSWGHKIWIVNEQIVTNGKIGMVGHKIHEKCREYTTNRHTHVTIVTYVSQTQHTLLGSKRIKSILVRTKLKPKPARGRIWRNKADREVYNQAPAPPNDTNAHAETDRQAHR